jgi:predicted ATPase
VIDLLELRNLKCFAQLTVPLSPLTLLAGANATGKSSLLQAFLLLRQSYDLGLLGEGRLGLNGALTQVGRAVDALHADAEEETISITLEEAEARLHWSFAYDRNADVLQAHEAVLREDLERSALFRPGFRYLQAERLGPRVTAPISEFEVHERASLGTQGEYTAHFLARYGEENAPNESVIPSSATSGSIRAVTEAWMREIAPGVRISVTPHPAMDVMQLQFAFERVGDVTDAFRPPNVGFGVTYALAPIVALVSAHKGDVLLLENPEAHLHPQAQTKVATLIALAADAGVQVIVETHSDHILNGFRVAVVDNVIPPEAIGIRFFEWGGGRQPAMRSPTVDTAGRLTEWPRGFFDEWDKSLESLLGGS